jgi:hypothetical protein
MGREKDESINESLFLATLDAVGIQIGIQIGCCGAAPNAGPVAGAVEMVGHGVSAIEGY